MIIFIFHMVWWQFYEINAVSFTLPIIRQWTISSAFLFSSFTYSVFLSSTVNLWVLLQCGSLWVAFQVQRANPWVSWALNLSKNLVPIIFNAFYKFDESSEGRQSHVSATLLIVDAFFISLQIPNTLLADCYIHASHRSLLITWALIPQIRQPPAQPFPFPNG